MPYREFPPIYGPFDSASLMNEDALKRLLRPGPQDPVADWYGHYRRCYYAVVEGKSLHIRNAIEQVTKTVMGLRKLGKTVTNAIIVADTFGSEIGIHRKGKELWRKVGREGQPIYADTIKRDIIIEGWQPGEWPPRW